jgi:hypothetical protein
VFNQTGKNMLNNKKNHDTVFSIDALFWMSFYIENRAIIALFDAVMAFSLINTI